MENSLNRQNVSFVLQLSYRSLRYPFTHLDSFPHIHKSFILCNSVSEKHWIFDDLAILLSNSMYIFPDVLRRQVLMSGVAEASSEVS